MALNIDEKCCKVAQPTFLYIPGSMDNYVEMKIKITKSIGVF